MNLETAIETLRAAAMISMCCAGIKMVEEHFNFPYSVNGLGWKISTDKAKTNRES